VSGFIAAVDSWKGEVMTKGWTQGSGKKAVELVRQLEPYCSEFLFTCIETEGGMLGTSIELADRLSNATSNTKSFAGGIASMAEVITLENLGYNAVLGMALYSGKISVKEIERFNKVDFAKGRGLVPAIAQDAQTGKVLMLAYMNREALNRTMETGRATYWSRSRQCMWEKGATSGNTQRVKEILLDCDRDTVLLNVEQKGNACHTGSYSCFFNKTGVRE